MPDLAFDHPTISPITRREVISQFWGISSDSLAVNEDSKYDSYFSYFEKECRLLREGNVLTGQGSTKMLVFKTLQMVRSGETRDQIFQKLESDIDGGGVGIREKELQCIIDLTIRLWLMIHINGADLGVRGLTPIPWTGQAFKLALASHFQHQIILTDSIKLDIIFNARNIERIADVRIQWTPNLVDHLRFIEDGKRPVLNIFHHAVFLQRQIENDMFPPNLILETLRTIALLLPMYDEKSKAWYKTQCVRLNLDPFAITYGQLKLEERQIIHFEYWHDRLVIIKQYFDESKPRTFKQWWYDDRKRVQWFWVAIVLVVSTILFGIIQCLEGGWQVWKAYHK